MEAPKDDSSGGLRVDKTNENSLFILEEGNRNKALSAQVSAEVQQEPDESQCRLMLSPSTQTEQNSEHHHQNEGTLSTGDETDPITSDQVSVRSDKEEDYSTRTERHDDFAMALSDPQRGSGNLVDLPGCQKVEITPGATKAKSKLRIESSGPEEKQEQPHPWLVHSKSRRVSIFTMTGDDGEDIEMVQFISDVFSIMIISDVLEPCFWFGMAIFAFQILILALIMVDLLDDDSLTSDGNRFNVPTNVELQVWVAQIMAIVIAAVSNDDARTSLRMISVGFHPSLKTEYAAASHAKFVFANLCRFAEGMLSAVVAFVFIVQSDNVLDIFLNFAAVEFIGNLDNLAFDLAAAGYIGEQLRKRTEQAEDIQLPISRNHLKSLGYFMFYLLIAGLISGWAVVRARQSNGYLLYKTSCATLDVQFGDQVLVMYPAKPIDIQGSYREARIQARFDYRNTNDSSALPQLFYAHFSGTYDAKVGSTGNRFVEKNDRPIYFERGIDDPTSGRFYYCEDELAWVFSIPALGDNIPEQTRTDNCDWGWLVISPQTEAFRLEEVESSDWNIWADDVLSTAENFSVDCGECHRDKDCMLSHGICNKETNVCECNYGWGGSSCEVELPFCEEIEWYMFGDTSKDFETSEPFSLFRDGSEGSPLVYDRPVYRLEHMASSGGRDCEGDGHESVVVYTGRRWYYTVWCPEEREHILDEDFHGYWDNILHLNTEKVSATTEGYKPTDDLDWKQINSIGSGRGTDPLGVTNLIRNAGFHCLNNDCDETWAENMCGDMGMCKDGVCDCIDWFGGFFCEIDPNGNYASTDFNEYKRWLLDLFSLDSTNIYTPTDYNLRWWKPKIEAMRATHMPAMVAINLDAYPTQNGYSVSETETGKVLEQVPVGKLQEVDPGAGYHTRLFYMKYGTNYTFTIEDSYGNGISGGDLVYGVFVMYPGYWHPMLLRPGTFGYGESRTFLQEPTVSTFPDPSSFVTGTIQVELVFHPRYYYETGYNITSDAGVVVADLPPTSFLFSWDFSSEFYNSKVFYLDPGSEYSFAIYDYRTDGYPTTGVKAEYNVSAVLSTGEKRLLVHGEPRYDINVATHTFVVPDEDLEREL